MTLFHVIYNALWQPVWGKGIKHFQNWTFYEHSKMGSLPPSPFWLRHCKTFYLGKFGIFFWFKRAKDRLNPITHKGVRGQKRKFRKTEISRKRPHLELLYKVIMIVLTVPNIRWQNVWFGRSLKSSKIKYFKIGGFCLPVNYATVYLLRSLKFTPFKDRDGPVKLAKFRQRPCYSSYSKPD